MNKQTAFLSLLTLATLAFSLLVSSLDSFSRIALAKFMKDVPGRRRFPLDPVEHFDLTLNVLKVFVHFLRFLLLATLFWILRERFAPVPLVLGLALGALVVFDLLLYALAHAGRELVFKSLMGLIPVAWYLFYPVNRILAATIHESGGEDRVPDEDEEPSDEELEAFFDEGTREGVIGEEDQEMIESVLEFGDTLVKEVMTPRVDMVFVRRDASLNDLVALINARKKSRMPVITDRIDHVVGVILAKDVFHCWRQERFDIERIIRPPFFIPETMRILELLKEMQRSKQKFAVVIDEFGGVSGVVSMEDIIEEIVGDIRDEYDDDLEAIVEEDGAYTVQGDTDVYELEERLGLDLEQPEDFQTVSGLLSFKLGKIPQPKDRVEIGGYLFEVLGVERNRIQKVKVTRVSEKA